MKHKSTIIDTFDEFSFHIITLLFIFPVTVGLRDILVRKDPYQTSSYEYGNRVHTLVKTKICISVESLYKILSPSGPPSKITIH